MTTTKQIQQLDPYRTTPQMSRSRLNCEVDVADANFVRGIYLIRGPFQSVLGTLFHRFVYELKRHGITDPSHSQQFLRAVAGCTVTFTGALNDDGGGTQPVREGPTNDADVVAKPPGRGRTRQGNGKTTKATKNPV